MSSAAGSHQVQIESAIAIGGERSRPRAEGDLGIRNLWALGLLSLTGIVMSACIVAGLVTGAGPAAHVGEWSPVTMLSAAQLVACSAFLAVIYWRRGAAKVPHERRWFAPRSLWLVMAGGFLFLAADELFEFHERFDLLIHQIFSLRETPLSDRIDDGIVLFYAIAGLTVLHRGRPELSLFRAAWPALRLAILLLFAMVALDLLTNRWFAPRGVDPDSATVKALAAWGTVAEESLKLVSGAMFVIAFAMMARAARSAAIGQGQYAQQRAGGHA